jgi:transposase
MKIENEWLRPAVCYLVLERKMKRKEVAAIFGVKPHTVGDAIKRYNETGGHNNRKGQGRKRTSTDEEHIEATVEHLAENNHTKRRNGVGGNSTRKLRRKLCVSRESVRRIFKRDLKLKAWKKKRCQKLVERTLKQRLTRATNLKRRFANGQHRLIFFTDEKFYTVEESHNPQNDRIWSEGAPHNDERVVQRQMKPQGVMVSAGIGYNAKGPLIFVDSGTKVDTDVYRKDILEPVEEWALNHYGTDENGDWNTWTFQQDGAPSHTSFKENTKKFTLPTQRWLEEHFPDFIKKNEWPASSPDLNPLDYSIWGIMDSEVNAESHASVEALKRTIQYAWDNLDQEVINKAIDDWPRRLDAVIEAEGSHIE